MNRIDRREFLGGLGLTAGGLGMGAGVGWLEARAAETPATSSSRSAPAKNWIWTGTDSNRTEGEQRRRFAGLREAGIHAVLFSGVDKEVFRLAKAEGLETHAWTWTLCRGDKELLEQHADWYGVSRSGESAAGQPPYVGYYHFLCPRRPEVREHLARIMGELAKTPHLDGVHLDYIRYPDVILPVALWKQYNLVQNEELPRYDFCYCPGCRRAFQAKAGVDPRELKDPPANEAWRQFRYDGVTELVNQLVEVVHREGRQITAAVFPTPSIARRLVRQDWVKWNLDAVLPMVYHSFYNEPVSWIEGAVREGVQGLQAQPGKRPLYAGLYLPELKTEADFDAAVRASMAGGAGGVSLFGGLRTIKA